LEEEDNSARRRKRRIPIQDRLPPFKLRDNKVFHKLKGAREIAERERERAAITCSIPP
jgi:hypothetical protein